MWLFQQFLCACLLSFTFAARDVQKMRWCGSGLNPLNMAKATRAATEMFLACKNHIIRFNIKPAIIHKVDKLCASWRVCYVVAEERTNKSATFEGAVVDCMQTMARTWVTIDPTCAGRFVPKDVNQILEAVKWMKDFISG
ncbi:uncharacterized protein LOC119390796 [Rhipicephalus sanguineus]|uniref:uncharacterized protein LOC119390796 n=1 Tax=Rhipicephalus sanguineus TaxID=34632 RepID=UPI0018962B3C|nr:uncharacterized protein LOC119390796 [Rhipicephalus sanguineus]